MSCTEHSYCFPYAGYSWPGCSRSRKQLWAIALWKFHVPGEDYNLFSCRLRDGGIPSDSLFHWLHLSHSSCLICCLSQCLCCCCPLGSWHVVFGCWLTHLPFLFLHNLTCMFLFRCVFSHLVFIYPSPLHPQPGTFLFLWFRPLHSFHLNPHPCTCFTSFYSSSCTSAPSPFSPSKFCTIHHIALLLRLYNYLQPISWRLLDLQPWTNCPPKSMTCCMTLKYFTENVFKCIGKYLLLFLIL